MKATGSFPRWSIYSVLGLISFGALVTLPTIGQVIPQEGYNAVCTSASGCSTTFASNAFIDASVFAGSTICAKIFNALQSAPPGAVIDARGISTNLSCNVANPDTPWQQGSATVNQASTVLLPAATITISYGWVLPDRTRVVGEGSNPSNGTKIQVTADNFGTMIQMGSAACSSGQCYGVSVEDLVLEGNGHVAVNGIVNQNSGESSYVEHVNFHQVEGVCVQVSGAQAQYSGPYSNLACGAGSLFNSNTKCFDLSASSTRGIHGMTCTTCGGCSNQPCCSQIPGPAITLDGSHNTLEDIHFEGYQDGILVGSTSEAQGNVILSINGGAGANNLGNVIHVSNAIPGGVTDLSIVGATAEVSSYPKVNVTNVIQDDVTDTIIPRNTSPDETTVAQYVIGDTIGGGFSRFATSPIQPSPPNAPTPLPTWGAGTAQPSAACPAGSLFSNVNGGTTNMLYKCTNGTWTAITIQP
jgi:hypothetical protein